MKRTPGVNVPSVDLTSVLSYLWLPEENDRLGGVRTTDVYFLSSGGWASKIRVPAD